MYACFFLILANSRVSRRRRRKTLKGWTSTWSTWPSLSLFKSFLFKMTSSIQVCALLPEQGLCKAKIDRFYFDPKVFFFFIVNRNDAKKNVATSCCATNNFVFPADRSVCDIWLGRLQGEWEQVEHWIFDDRGEWWWLRLRLGWGPVWWQLW